MSSIINNSKYILIIIRPRHTYQMYQCAISNIEMERGVLFTPPPTPQPGVCSDKTILGILRLKCLTLKPKWIKWLLFDYTCYSQACSQSYLTLILQFICSNTLTGNFLTCILWLSFCITKWIAQIQSVSFTHNGLLQMAVTIGAQLPSLSFHIVNSEPFVTVHCHPAQHQKNCVAICVLHGIPAILCFKIHVSTGTIGYKNKSFKCFIEKDLCELRYLSWQIS